MKVVIKSDWTHFVEFAVKHLNFDLKTVAPMWMEHLEPVFRRIVEYSSAVKVYCFCCFRLYFVPTSCWKYSSFPVHLGPTFSSSDLNARLNSHSQFPITTVSATLTSSAAIDDKGADWASFKEQLRGLVGAATIVYSVYSVFATAIT